MIHDSSFEIRCGLHDYAFHSIFHGEPFLTGDVLWFFDGQNLRVIGYDRHLTPITREAFIETIREARDRFAVRTIRLESPRMVSIRRDCRRYSREIISRPKPYEFEVFVSGSSFRETSRLRNEVRQARNAGLRCEVIDGECRSLHLRHWRLLKAHIQSFQRQPYFEAELLSAVVYLLADPATAIFEVSKDEDFKGFALARRSGAFANFHFLAIAPEMNGVSDLIYDSLIRHFLERGVHTISLGSTPTKGLFEYKRKWGIDFMLPGTYEIGWVDEAQRQVEPRHFWMSQFLKGRLRA